MGLGYLTGQSLGGGSSTIEAPEPIDVYNDTRPNDWLSMPNPYTDEAYLLFHVSHTEQELFALTVTCTGDYTISLGTVVNGLFSVVSSTVIVSGSKYETSFNYNAWGDLTSDGFKQIMIKISGVDILTIATSTHTLKTNSSSWNVVEFSGNLPSCENITFGSTVSAYYSLSKLVYFSLYGSNAITSMVSMFQNCNSLKAILYLDSSKVTTMYSMLYNCYSLIAIPLLETALVTNMGYMFCQCRTIRTIPLIDTSLVTNTSNMFYNCHSLINVPLLNTSNVTDMGSMFYSCSSLRTVSILDSSNVSNMSSMFSYCIALITVSSLDTTSLNNMSSIFNGCYLLENIPPLYCYYVTNTTTAFSTCRSLTRLLLTSSLWTAPQAIDLTNASFSRQAIVDFFNSLPTITTAKAITLTGNFGVSSLTADDKLIATAKGWTLTL